MENLDKNNSMVLKLGPEEMKQIIHGQIGFFKDKEKHDPNMLCIGLAVLQILDQTMAFTKNDQGECYFENLQVYLDPANEIAINVGYSPFLTKQGLIL